MRETQESISAWAEATFGPAGSNIRRAARANEEMAELLKHLATDDNHPAAAEEIADIVIVLSRVMTRLGKSLPDEIDRKMQINRAREWRLDGTGHGYHVKPAPLPRSEVCPGRETGGTAVPCCPRAGEYNGYGSDGPLLFHCPKSCGCHD